jgi:hypothetical protein
VASGEVVALGSGQQNTSAPTSATTIGWDNVGNFVQPASGVSASAVYLGNGWVLSASHVFNPGESAYVVFDGDSYNYDTTNSWYHLTNPDGSTSDVSLFKLSTTPTTLSSVALPSSAETYGTTVYSIGYGLSLNNSAPQFYSVTGTGTNTTWTPTTQELANEGLFSENGGQMKLWGENVIVEGTAFINNQGTANNIYGFYTAFDAEYTNTAQELASGDSGGGVFNTQGQFVGMNDATWDGTYNQPESPYTTAAYGQYPDESSYADIYEYLGQIESITGVPEPASIGLGTVAFAALALRRHRRNA